jgi:hypothetical protein
MLVRQGAQPRNDVAFWRGLEEKMWAGHDPDTIEERVLATVASIEAFCRPVLSARGRALH